VVGRRCARGRAGLPRERVVDQAFQHGVGGDLAGEVGGDGAVAHQLAGLDSNTCSIFRCYCRSERVANALCGGVAEKGYEGLALSSRDRGQEAQSAAAS
jgi:hypothetical protein